MASTHRSPEPARPAARPGRCRPCPATRHAAAPAPGPAGLGALPGGPLVRVQLLGPVRAWRGGRPLPPGPPQRQLLLSVLALSAPAAVSRDELVDVLWDQAPASAISTLHKHVSVLRGALEPGHQPGATRLLASVAGGYELRLQPAAVDAAVFARHRVLARAARATGDLPRALHHLTTALALWHGSALCGLPGPRAQALRQDLEEARLAAVEDRADILLALGAPGELTGELTGLAARYPLREGLCYRLMLARYQAGHPAGALSAYHTLRRALADELGTDPGPPLQRLHQQILRRDPRLDPPPAPA
jgi:DNA-binding SARP family transcriptional activator